MTKPVKIERVQVLIKITVANDTPSIDMTEMLLQVDDFQKEHPSIVEAVDNTMSGIIITHVFVPHAELEVSTERSKTVGKCAIDGCESMAETGKTHCADHQPKLWGPGEV